MGVPVSPAWIITVMAVAIALLLVLVVFSGKLPPRVRRVLEAFVSIGYPAVVMVYFGYMAWSHYVQAEVTSAGGFGVGAVIMAALVVRAIRRFRMTR